MAERFGKIAFAGDAGELRLGPWLEGFHFRTAFFLAAGTSGIAGLAVDLVLDVIEITDPGQRFAGDFGFGGGVGVEDVATQMRPAGGLADAGFAGCIRVIKRLEAGIGIGLQDAAEPCQVALRTFALAVDRQEASSALVARCCPKAGHRGYRSRCGLP